MSRADCSTPIRLFCISRCSIMRIILDSVRLHFMCFDLCGSDEQRYRDVGDLRPDLGEKK